MIFNFINTNLLNYEINNVHSLNNFFFYFFENLSNFIPALAIHRIKLLIIGIKMTAPIFIVLSAILNGCAIVLLFKDCYRGYGSTMGGEVFAGFLWTLGAAFLTAGVYFASGASFLLALLSLIGLSLISLPSRRAVIWLGTKYGKTPSNRQSSGFVEYVQIEKALKKNESECKKSGGEG